MRSLFGEFLGILVGFFFIRGSGFRLGIKDVSWWLLERMGVISRRFF